MKKTTFILHSIKAVTALFVATVMTMGLAACSDDDSTSSTSGPGGQLASDLVGTWLSSYSQKGSLSTGKGGTVDYIKAVQAMTFNSDGTGICWKFLCDMTGEPVSLFGGEGDAINGRFHYSVGADSTITIIRDGDGNNANPKTWTLRAGKDGLDGTDGTTTYQLHSANAEWQAYVTGLEEEYRSGGNAENFNDQFLTDWQNCKMVYIEGIAAKQYTPWAGTANNDIADAIRFDVQKEAGWEMAFCVLNDPNSINTRFFALYNRFTGTLRVFSYVLDAGSQGYGDEIGYMFQADGDKAMPRYPLYNSMEYAIPICHDYKNPDTFDAGMALSTNGTNYMPFETMLSAYTRKTEASGVSSGWHCTDFDFSGYTEKGIHWTDNAMDEGTLLSVSPYSQKTSNVLLTGSIIGEMKGEFSDPKYKTKTTGCPALSAISGIVGAISGTYGNLFNSTNQAYSLFSNADKLRGNSSGILSDNTISALFCGGGILSIASCGLKIADQFWGEHKEQVEVSPGTISMTLDAKVDLNGTIKEWSSVNDAGVRVTPNLLKATNKSNGPVWMGSGCFGLAKDPVICVAQNDLLSVSKSISITKKGDNYTAPSFAKDSVRLISFLDPRTVELCLNTDLYHDIKDLIVTINYGVNTNRPAGNTDCYRNMLKLGKRPTFTLNPNSDGKITTTTAKTKLHVMTKDKVIKNDLYCQAKLDSVKLDYQQGTVLPIYGHYESFLGKRFVMDPQVFIPFNPEAQNTTVFAPVIPDFVVTVMVGFKCKECPDGVVFSRLYIPEIKLIDHSALATYYTDLSAYAEKCVNKQPIGTLHNDQNVNVYNKIGDIMLAKTLDILKTCK